MWQEITKEEFAKNEYPLVSGGEMVGGGFYKEWGISDGNGFYRWQKNIDGSEHWFQYVAK